MRTLAGFLPDRAGAHPGAEPPHGRARVQPFLLAAGVGSPPARQAAGPTELMRHVVQPLFHSCGRGGQEKDGRSARMYGGRSFFVLGLGRGPLACP
jgi:hypothetical protein